MGGGGAGPTGGGGQGGDAGQGGGGGAGGATYHAFVMLERWIRADPAAQHTIGAIAPFYQDSRLPHFGYVDAWCGYHEGDWREPDRLPPSFGAVHMDIPQLGTVAWTETSVSNAYEPPGGTLGWDTGDTLKVVATGGDVPGFTLEDTVPSPAVLTSHDLSSLTAGELVIPRDQPFSLTWEPAPAEVFALFLQFDDASYIQHGVWCFFPGDTGSAVVSPELLGHLVPSSMVASTNFYFSGASREHLALEGVDLEMVTWNGEAARVLVQ